MREIPVISVIIPVYNAEKYVGKCLDSVLAQNYKNFEILCFNDGSPDSSLRILREYEKKDGRIKVIDQENMGVAKTRNKGIKMARGKYLVFVDNDDTVAKDYLEKMLELIEADEADLVIGGFSRVDERDRSRVLYSEKLKNTYYARYVILTPWARMIKRDFLIKNKVEYFSYGIGEDVYFNMVLYDCDPRVVITKYIGYFQSYNPVSVSNTKQKGLNKKLDCRVLLDKVKHDCTRQDNDYLNFFFHKYIIWYLLFSGRHATTKEYMAEYKRLFAWEEKNVKERIMSSFDRRVSGELAKTRVIIWIFDSLRKMGLMALFAKVYCRGR